MPAASVTIDHLAEKSFPGAYGGPPVARRERCKGRFNQNRTLGSLDLASKYIE